MTVPFRDFGWFFLPDGRKALLTWWADGDGPVTLDGPGGPILLGFIPTEEDAVLTLGEYADHGDDRDGLMWVRTRIAAYELLASCKVCCGSGILTVPDPFTRTLRIQTICPACTAGERR